MRIKYIIERIIEVRDNMTDTEINMYLDEITDNECTMWYRDGQGDIREETCGKQKCSGCSHECIC